jgi:hypothetical protein
MGLRCLQDVEAVTDEVTGIQTAYGLNQGLQGIPMMTFENPLLQLGDDSSCTPISNLLRGQSANGPPDETKLEKLVQQDIYVTETVRIRWVRSLTLFMMMLFIFVEYFWSNGMVGVDSIRLLTVVELSLSCTCANTDDSASNPLPSTYTSGGFGEGANR